MWRDPARELRLRIGGAECAAIQCSGGKDEESADDDGRLIRLHVHRGCVFCDGRRGHLSQGDVAQDGEDALGLGPSDAEGAELESRQQMRRGVHTRTVRTAVCRTERSSGEDVS